MEMYENMIESPEDLTRIQKEKNQDGLFLEMIIKNNLVIDING